MFQIIILMSSVVMAMAVSSPGLEEGPHQTKKIVDLNYGGPTGLLRFVDLYSDDIGYVPDIEAQNRIIESIYSPAFLQPIWYLDHRHVPMKSDDYMRPRGHHDRIHSTDDDEHKHDMEHHKNNEQNGIGMVGHKNIGEDVKYYKNDPMQVYELNRLRHLQRDGDRARVRLATGSRKSGSHEHNAHETEDYRRHNTDLNKGYNPAWAFLPDVAFAGRNH